MKRVLAAAASATLIPLGLAAPAQAAGSCTVTTPSRITVSSSYREVPVTYSRGCLAAESASWDVIHPTEGLQEFLWYQGDGDRTDSMDWYDWNPLGVYKVRPEGASDANYDDMSQNSRTIDVRLGSRVARTSVTRSGSTVRLSGRAQRYSSTAGEYRSWRGAKVGVYSRSCSSCSWTRLKTVTADSTGRVATSVTVSSKRTFRLRTLTTSNTWGGSGTAIAR